MRSACRSGRPSTAGSERGRASDQRTSPSGSSAASSFARATTTNRPNGDHDASRQSPSRRFEPSAWTTQTPSADSTSSGYGAGSGEEAGCALDAHHLADGVEHGLSGWAGDRAGHDGRRRQHEDRRHALRSRGAGVRSPHAARTTCHARASAPSGGETAVELHGIVSCNWSSPWRSRESVAVPRGRSSRRAISPGV